MKKKGCNIDTR